MDTITRSYERSAQLSLFRQVYLWMAMALVITGFMAMLVAESPTLLSLIFSSKLTFFGLIIAGLVNLFLQSSLMSLIVSGIGVLVFVGLTAYDSQKIKRMLLQEGLEVNDSTRKIALLGSLTLYLDFINLFLYLLRFLGDRRG